VRVAQYAGQGLGVTPAVVVLEMLSTPRREQSAHGGARPKKRANLVMR
jgi:hypothetical protein